MSAAAYRVIQAFKRQVVGEEVDTTPILDAQLKKHPKGGWWDPPKNYTINRAIMGLNTWRYTILPLFASRGGAYHPASESFPEGIVIDPSWRPVGQNDPTKGNTVPDTPQVAEILIRVAKSARDITETVKLELRWIEQKHGVKIPSAIESKLVAEWSRWPIVVGAPIACGRSRSSFPSMVRSRSKGACFLDAYVAVNS